MRFYNVVINVDSEYLEENAIVKMSRYYKRLGAVNDYLYTTLEDDLYFMMYRETPSGKIEAVFSYDNKKYSYGDAYGRISDVLDKAFKLGNKYENEREITALEFYESYREGRRKEYINCNRDVIWKSGLDVYDYCRNNDKFERGFDLEEFIISDERMYNDKNFIYDKSLEKELSNIERNKLDSKISGNVVHYVVTGRSIDAEMEMVRILAGKLYDAGRIKTRRVEVLKEIGYRLHKITNGYFEDVVEKNAGGLVVIDLTERFGNDITEYKLTCEYIKNIVKSNRNNCLFVFTYNMEHPGFSYYLLPDLRKYIIPVTLREGTGTKKNAIAYMKNLIDNSDISEGAKYASEYMKELPGNVFTQTDVIEAFEKFESWYLKKYVFDGYDVDIDGEFMLDRDENSKSAYDRLQSLIGLEEVKIKIDGILAMSIVEKERKMRRGSSYKTSTGHMIFAGNPGTAKTTVAKLFAQIGKERGVLSSGAFVECGGMDLDGMGCVEKIRDAFYAAKGGVLFIDEAYSLKSDTAVTTLVQEMENRREDVIVVLAGYGQRMEEFLELNDGLKSRIPYTVDFPDYGVDELVDIFKLMVNDRGFRVEEAAVQEAKYIFEKVSLNDNFGNGRYVRNFVEHAIQNQSVRLMEKNTDAGSIGRKEIFFIKKCDLNMLDEGLEEEREPGTAGKELDDMIGLESVKTTIRRAVSGFKLIKMCSENGIKRDRASLHMVFTGNPGTAKTTVARLFAEILRDENVLPTAKFVEVGRAELIGGAVGQTAPKVKQRFRDAQGGVLFIDEAYSLCDCVEGGYGDEAINTIVQEMENNRDKVIVIFAGYPDKMKHFLDRNPGLNSRIAYQVNFDDYTTDELCDITRLMLEKKSLTITDEAFDRLKSIYDTAREAEDYGNGRFVRKMLEQAELNLAERVVGLKEKSLDLKLISTIEYVDIPEYDVAEPKMKFGFAS